MDSIHAGPPGQPTVAPSTDAEPIFTIHIIGLPHDVKQRELFNLFRESGGCVSRLSRGSIS